MNLSAAQLVYAINVPVKNCVDKGATWGDRTFNSFDSWTGVMSGIFRDAGIPGLLDNIDDYIQNKNVDDVTKAQFASLLFEMFKLDHFSKNDAFQALNGQGFGSSIELPIKQDPTTKRSASTTFVSGLPSTWSATRSSSARTIRRSRSSSSGTARTKTGRGSNSSS